MDEKELKAILEEAAKNNGVAISESVKKEVAEAVKGLLTPEALASKLESLGITEGAIEKITKALEAQGEEMRKFADAPKPSNQRKSMGAQIIEALKANKLLDTPLRKGEHRTIEVKDLDIVGKVAAAMGTGNVDAVGTNSIPYELSQFEAGLTRVVRRRPWILDIANTSPINTMYAQWAEQENPDGTAGETAQGAAKNMIDFDWVEKSAKVEKLTAYIKVSKEALSDLPGLQNEIDTELRETVLLAADAALLSGDGSTPSLNGLLNQDTAYSAGSFAATIENPNKSDVLRTAIAQVVANQFIPNYALLHPDDVAAMDLEKGADGHYVLAPFKSADGMTISGVRILENTGQTVDKFTVGDFSKLNVRVRQGMTVDIGLDADDFTKNLVTILGEIRLVSYVKTNHAGAFVSGDFSDAITELAAP